MGFLNQEELLEPVWRYVRFWYGSKYLSKDKSVRILDIGCGQHIRFYHFAKKIGIKISEYVGIDPLVNKSLEKNGIKLIKAKVKNKILMNDNSFDVIIAFAFIEHIDSPGEIVKEMIRVLKPGGVVILTTPTPLAKIWLELLAYRLHFLSTREIAEHKNYFSKKDLIGLLPKTGVKYKHSYLSLRMNNLLILTKE